MDTAALCPWKIEDHLVEQPSWGGRYIVDLKGLSHDTAWAGKKVGQSYELAKESKVLHPVTHDIHRLADLINDSPEFWLGEQAATLEVRPSLLLIKLTQAKGNSFQVHLPEGKSLGHWLPKPEAWFYLGPGLYTFGLKPNIDYGDFSQALRDIDAEMHRLSDGVVVGHDAVDAARALAQQFINERDLYKFVNVVEAKTDDIVDLTAGGIHHSWEEDNARFPDGNLVYEVQVDVQDEYCSMRGFDKGKILDDGNIRPTHVDDYLETVQTDPEHNELSRHIQRPTTISESAGSKIESIFRTAYFSMDRIALTSGGSATLEASSGMLHIFVLDGSASCAGHDLVRGGSYVLPAAIGKAEVSSRSFATLLITYAPATV